MTGDDCRQARAALSDHRPLHPSWPQLLPTVDDFLDLIFAFDIIFQVPLLLP